MVRKTLAGIVLLGTVAIALFVARAGAASTTYSFRAHLATTGSTSDAVAANGILTGKLTLAGKKSSFTWTLTFKHLSGKATHADIYFGASAKARSLALPLCVKCQAPSAHGAYVGPYVATSTFVQKFVHGGTYAVISTKKNPKGEIRGQIKTTSA